VGISSVKKISILRTEHIFKEITFDQIFEQVKNKSYKVWRAQQYISDGGMSFTCLRNGKKAGIIGK
jgi:hypothetical protein